MARKNGIIISISKNRMGRIGRNRCNPHLPSCSIDERGLRICPANFVGKSSIRFQARNREKKFEIPRAHATVFSMEPRGFRYWTGGGGDRGNEGSRNFLSVQSEGRAPRHVDFEATEASAEAFSKFLSASRLFDRPVPSVGMAPDHRDHLSRGPR